MIGSTNVPYTSLTYSVEITTSDWSASAPYEKTISCDGITEYHILEAWIDEDNTLAANLDAARDAFIFMTIEPGDGEIMITTDEIPTAAFFIKMKGV